MFCATEVGVMTIGVKAEKRRVGKTLIKHSTVAPCQCVLMHSGQISLLKGGLLFFVCFVLFFLSFYSFFHQSIFFFQNRGFCVIIFFVQLVLLLIGGASSSLQAIRRRA